MKTKSQLAEEAEAATNAMLLGMGEDPSWWFVIAFVVKAQLLSWWIMLQMLFAKDE